MAKPYSIDLRERAMARLASGATSREVAAAFDVAVSSVIKWASRQRRTGSLSPGKMGGHRPFLISKTDREWVLGEVDRQPHVTLAALAKGLEARGLKLHPASIARFLHREGKSFKKNAAARRATQAEAGKTARTVEAASGHNQP